MSTAIAIKIAKVLDFITLGSKSVGWFIRNQFAHSLDFNYSRHSCPAVEWNLADSPFKFSTERPITAIREASLDNNPKTQPDSTWEPLITTPPFPSYVSGHSTFSGSAATLLKRFFRSDNIAFITSSDAMPGELRSFDSFSAAAGEAGQSWIYGGIHFDFDDKDGQQAGKQLADYVFSHFLR